MSKTAVIIGAGICGPVTALSLLHYKSDYISRIYELRPKPSTLGGAINLDPNALRVFKMLGLYERILSVGQATEHIDMWSTATGANLGRLTMKYGDVDSVRILRKSLHAIILEACLKKDIQIIYGKKLVRVDVEKGDVEFEDGSKDSGDVVLGCDGTHSAVRQSIDGRKAKYTGIDASYGFTDVSLISPTAKDELARYLPRKTAAMIRSLRGNMILCFSDPTKPNQLYFGAVVEGHPIEAEILHKAGWKAKGADVAATRNNLVERFGGQNFGFLTELLGNGEDISFYPVYELEAGNWAKGKVILLGDAAHAMPPQGQGVGLALEDAALAARLLASTQTVEEAMARFENIRKPRIAASYKKVARMKENIGDVAGGYWSNLVAEWFYWLAVKIMGATVWGKDWGYNVDELDIKK